MMDNLPPELQKAIPGVAGSLTALALMVIRGERFKHAVLMCICGITLARYMATLAATVMHSTEGVAGFVVGLFGMAIVAKVLDTIMTFDGRRAAREAWLAWLAIFKRTKEK